MNTFKAGSLSVRKAFDELTCFKQLISDEAVSVGWFLGGRECHSLKGDPEATHFDVKLPLLATTVFLFVLRTWRV